MSCSLRLWIGCSMKMTKGNKPRPHLFLPSEAVMAIDILENYTPKSNLHHVAFILGISRKHLTKVRTRLIEASQGDIEACSEYNSRIPVMRALASYHRLIDLDPEFIRTILEDARISSDPTRNILHARGKDSKELTGMTQDEVHMTTEQFRDYSEN